MEIKTFQKYDGQCIFLFIQQIFEYLLFAIQSKVLAVMEYRVWQE